MERITRFRATILLLLLAALILFLAGRLYYLQIIETGGQVDNTTTFTTVTRVKAARGSISDRDGNVLVGNRASYDLVINHYVLTNSENPNAALYSLVKLCEELGIEYTEHFPVTRTAPFRYTLDEANSAWKGYFQTFLESRGSLDSDITAPLLIRELRSSYLIPEEWTDEEARAVLGLRYELSLRALSTGLSNFVFLTDVSTEHLAAISELNIPGMNVEASTVREYHTDYAAHVLGYVGAMSPSQWEYYQTVDNVEGISDYLMDAEVGQTGFELAFEEYLHGIDGWRYDTVTSDGTVIESWYDPAPIAGSNVEITLDMDLQQAGEEALDELFTDLVNQDEGKDGQDAKGGALVVMEVGTGEVLVCASYPTYDLKSFFENYELYRDDERNPLLNRALGALYPPGSTMKPAMVVAGFNAGIINSKTVIEDKGEMELDGGLILRCLQYTNYGNTHNNVTPAFALTVSCNYFFYELANRMPIELSDPVVQALGLGEKTGVELYEERGYRANPETKDLLYNTGYDVFTIGDRLTAAIGQSDHLVTPIQLCNYVSTIANQGVRYRATFLNRVVTADYSRLILEQEPRVENILAISDEAYGAVVEGMKGVAHTYDGTAWQTFMSYPITICAKTGTAETGYITGSDNGAFICFAPADNPQIAIAVYGENAGHGSTMAQVAKAILDVYFAVDEVNNTETYENLIG